MSEIAQRESQLQRLKSSIACLRRRARPAATQASDRLARELTRQVAALGSFLMDPDLLHWSTNLTQSAASTATDGALLQAAAGYARTIWKDVSPLSGKAPSGMPELLSAGLGAVGLVFVLQRGDLQRLSELLGSMGITAITSANPLLGLSMVATTGYGYWQAKSKGQALVLDRTSALRGAALAGSSAAVFTVMGGPVVVKLVVAIAVTGALRKLTTPVPQRALAAVRPTVRVSPAFVSDRELVDAMRL